VDAGLVAPVGEAGVGDGALKVLAHLVFVDDFADGFPDGTGPGEPAGGHAFGDGRQGGFGGGQQGGAFAGAFDSQGGVAAGDQPFAGVVGVGDLGQILGVEQAHLQRAVIGGEFGDLEGA